MEFMIVPAQKILHINKKSDFQNITKDYTVIYIHCKCEEYMNSLPSHIESIVIYTEYENELNNLPPNLKKLYLGYYYNQLLHYLPETLEYLSIGHRYSLDLLYLPKSIRILELHSNYIKNINLDLPNLTILALKYITGDIIYENIMNIYNQLYKVQNTLRELYLPYNFIDNLKTIENFTILEALSYKSTNNINQFPRNLKTLELLYYNHPLTNLPDTLETLILDVYCNQDLNNLPKNLKVLNMGGNIDCNLFVNYPETLEELIIIETHPDRYHICGYEKYKFKITLTEDVEERNNIIRYYNDN